MTPSENDFTLMKKIKALIALIAVISIFVASWHLEDIKAIANDLWGDKIEARIQYLQSKKQEGEE